LLFCEWNTSHAFPPPALLFPQRSVRDRRHKLILNLLAGTRNPAEEYYTTQAVVQTGPTQAEIDAADAPVRAAYQTWRAAPPVELYDLTADPDELVNLADRADLLPVRQRLERELAAWRRATDDPLLDPRKLALLVDEHSAWARKKDQKRQDIVWRYPEYLYAPR
jgi:N-sulfoglucosamine sulfohydrolase